MWFYCQNEWNRQKTFIHTTNALNSNYVHSESFDCLDSSQRNRTKCRNKGALTAHLPKIASLSTVSCASSAFRCCSRFLSDLKPITWLFSMLNIWKNVFTTLKIYNKNLYLGDFIFVNHYFEHSYRFFCFFCFFPQNFQVIIGWWKFWGKKTKKVYVCLK